MNKMEIQMREEVNVIKLVIIFFAITALFQSCKINYNKRNLLSVILNDIKSETGNTILVLEKNNSNELILDRFNKFIKFNDIQKDSIVDLVFSENEQQNYKNQTTTDSTWENKFEAISDVSLEWKNDNDKRFIHISKPIYSLDKNYALMYYIIKGKKDVYFMPKIHVYYKEKKSWKKVYILPSRQFKD